MTTHEPTTADAMLTRERLEQIRDRVLSGEYGIASSDMPKIFNMALRYLDTRAPQTSGTMRGMVLDEAINAIHEEKAKTESWENREGMCLAIAAIEAIKSTPDPATKG
jgi:hypothetical protein